MSTSQQTKILFFSETYEFVIQSDTSINYLANHFLELYS